MNFDFSIMKIIRCRGYLIPLPPYYIPYMFSIFLRFNHMKIIKYQNENKYPGGSTVLYKNLIVFIMNVITSFVKLRRIAMITDFRKNNWLCDGMSWPKHWLHSNKSQKKLQKRQNTYRKKRVQILSCLIPRLLMRIVRNPSSQN